MGDLGSVPSWCYVGAEVVSIKAFNSDNEAAAISKGQDLTIRDYFVNTDGDIGLKFNEVRNPPTNTFLGVMERGYTIEGFAPIVKNTMEADLAIFAPLLETKNIEEMV